MRGDEMETLINAAQQYPVATAHFVKSSLVLLVSVAIFQRCTIYYQKINKYMSVTYFSASLMLFCVYMCNELGNMAVFYRSYLKLHLTSSSDFHLHLPECPMTFPPVNYL